MTSEEKDGLILGFFEQWLDMAYKVETRNIVLADDPSANEKLAKAEADPNQRFLTKERADRAIQVLRGVLSGQLPPQQLEETLKTLLPMH